MRFKTNRFRKLLNPNSNKRKEPIKKKQKPSSRREHETMFIQAQKNYLIHKPHSATDATDMFE